MMSDNPDDKTRVSAAELNKQREAYLTQLQTEAGVASDISGHPSPDEPAPQIATSDRVGGILYAWQMRVDDGWNIVGMKLQTGQYLPLVTTSMPLAWEAFEIAQAHANVNQCQVRLAAFEFTTLCAVIDPNDT